MFSLQQLLQILEQSSVESKTTVFEEVAERLSALKKEVEEIGLSKDVLTCPIPSSPTKVNLNVKNRSAFKEVRNEILFFFILNCKY